MPPLNFLSILMLCKVSVCQNLFLAVMDVGLAFIQCVNGRSFMNSVFELLIKVWTGSRDLMVCVNLSLTWLFFFSFHIP